MCTNGVSLINTVIWLSSFQGKRFVLLSSPLVRSAVTLKSPLGWTWQTGTAPVNAVSQVTGCESSSLYVWSAASCCWRRSSGYLSCKTLKTPDEENCADCCSCGSFSFSSPSSSGCSSCCCVLNEWIGRRSPHLVSVVLEYCPHHLEGFHTQSGW